MLTKNTKHYSNTANMKLQTPYWQDLKGVPEDHLTLKNLVCNFLFLSIKRFKIKIKANHRTSYNMI